MTGISKTLAAGITAAFLLLGTSQSQAATFNLSLQGVAGDGSYSGFNDGFTQYDQWSLALTGLSSDNSFVVSNGDTINATITLDHSFTIPASDQLTSFSFFLDGTSFPDIDTEVTGTTSFFSDGVAGPAGGTSTSTRHALVNGVVFFPPNNGAITFDSVTSSFTVTTLDQPATLDSASISFTRFDNIAAVPEPAETAMLLAGLGIFGMLARRRKSAAA
jgi:hypothetical protein